MKPLFALTLALAALTSCTKAPKADPADPASYAVRVPVEPASGASLQRVVLPPAALVAIRRADKGDIRVFDGRDKTLPIAFDSSAQDVEMAQTVPIYPITGATGSADTAGLSITIDSKKIAHVVGVEKVAAAGQGGAALLDLRTVAQPVKAVVFDAELPVGRPVAVTLDASGNLKDWRPIGEKVLFRPEADPELLGGGRFDLGGVVLKGQYIRASWADAKVVLKSASVRVSSSLSPQRLTVAAGAPELSNAHDLRFSLNLPSPPAALRIIQTGPDGIIPVTLKGRNSEEEGWTLISAATIRQGDAGEGTAGRNMLDLSGPAYRAYRIEADKRTSGFSAPPRVELLFDPASLIVAFNGAPPYQLVAGLGGAPPAMLELSELAPRGVQGNAPVAKVIGGETVPPLSLTPGGDDIFALGKKSILWLVLLLGTAVLAFALYRLMRSPPVGPAKESNP